LAGFLPSTTFFSIPGVSGAPCAYTIAAAGLGGALLQSKDGLREIQRLLQENVENAKAQGESEKAEDLERILVRFKRVHPF
jgi:hypothetical protein